MQLQLQWASTTQTLDGNGECEQWQWASTTQTLGGNGECEQCAHCLSYTFANAYTIPHRYAHTRILTRKHAHTHIHVHTHHACNATYLDDRQKLSWSAADWSRSATNKCIKHVTVGIILIRYQSWIASIVVARNVVQVQTNIGLLDNKHLTFASFHLPSVCILFNAEIKLFKKHSWKPKVERYTRFVISCFLFK